MTDAVEILPADSYGIRTVHAIITAQEFDCFASATDAQVHAEAEGIDLEELTPTRGTDGDEYIRVPRLYPATLNFQLIDASVALGVYKNKTTFLHADRDAITLGHTHPTYLPNHKHLSRANFAKSPDGRSASIRALSPDFVQCNFPPAQEAGNPKESSFQDINLSLGRAIVSELTSQPEDEERALRDIFRDWESVLVVGRRAVNNFIESAIAASETPDSPRKNVVSEALNTVASSGML